MPRCCKRSCRCLTVRRLMCLVVCLVIATFTIYRVQTWLTQYSKLGSKMVISAYDEQQRELPFPLITICNINPARGLVLYNPKSSSPGTRGVDYELFSDAAQGWMLENAPNEKLQTPIYRLVDQASHKLKDMLKWCVAGRSTCSADNFTKSVLPTGACYTFHSNANDYDEVQLTLDPQSYDYLIPNQGFVGFRILLHGLGDPKWAMIPGAVYAGPTFHTMLRVVGLKKVYRNQCFPHQQWARCMHQCMQEMLYKRCKCHMSDCTLLDMMRCGQKMHSIIENMLPSKCRCLNPCEQVTYSVESITQALKPPLFNHMSKSTQELPRLLGLGSNGISAPSGIFAHSNRIQRDASQNGMDIHKKEIRDGYLIQLWAFLRESNRTAFEEFRQLARLLQSLNMDLQTVERAVTLVDFNRHTSTAAQHNPLTWEYSGNRSKGRTKADRPGADGLCMESEEHSRILSRVRRLGEEFVRLFRQSILFRDVTNIPGEDLHVHLVRLFFLRVIEELDRLADQLQHNDLFSDVTMLDLQRKAHNCKPNDGDQVTKPHRSENHSSAWLPLDGRVRLTETSGDIAGLQAVLLATDTQFKQLRSTFTKLTLDNQELIEAVPVEHLKRISVLQDEQSLVTITIQLTRDKNRLVRLESMQAIYNPLTELFDIIVSGLVLSFLAIFLMDMCFAGTKTGRTPLGCELKESGLKEDITTYNKHDALPCSQFVQFYDSTNAFPKLVSKTSCPTYTQHPPSFEALSIPNSVQPAKLCAYCSACTHSEWSTMNQNKSASQTHATCEGNDMECDSSNKDTDSGKPSSSAITQTAMEYPSQSQQWEVLGTEPINCLMGNRPKPPEVPVRKRTQSPKETVVDDSSSTFGNSSVHVPIIRTVHHEPLPVSASFRFMEEPTNTVNIYGTYRMDHTDAVCPQPHNKSSSYYETNHVDQPFQAIPSPSILYCEPTKWGHVCECGRFQSHCKTIHPSSTIEVIGIPHHSFNPTPTSTVLYDTEQLHLDIAMRSPLENNVSEPSDQHSYSPSNVV